MRIGWMAGVRGGGPDLRGRQRVSAEKLALKGAESGGKP